LPRYRRTAIRQSGARGLARWIALRLWLLRRPSPALAVVHDGGGPGLSRGDSSVQPALGAPVRGMSPRGTSSREGGPHDRTPRHHPHRIPPTSSTAPTAASARSAWRSSPSRATSLPADEVLNLPILRLPESRSRHEPAARARSRRASCSRSRPMSTTAPGSPSVATSPGAPAAGPAPRWGDRPIPIHDRTEGS
jgi:hypothetical protein